MKLVFVGAAAHDAVALVPSYPHDDQRVLAEAVLSAGGGPAATAAVAAARLGAEVALIAPVGDDEEGHRVRRGLQEEGVDVSLVWVDKDRQTQRTLVICSRDTASRAIVTREAMPFALGDEARATILAADWVHADHLGWSAVAQALKGTPREGRPRLSIDPGNSLVGDQEGLCRIEDVHLYAPPLARMQARDHQDPREILAACPAETVVATLGPDGSIGRTREGLFVRAPGFSVPGLLSTLGAGDVFHGALLTAVSRGEGLSDALRYANAVAALSCRGIDGRSAIPSHEEASLFVKESL
ncbi:carbohydrate kinase family protein [Sinomonas atrocyanea]